MSFEYENYRKIRERINRRVVVEEMRMRLRRREVGDPRMPELEEVGSRMSLAEGKDGGLVVAVNCGGLEEVGDCGGLEAVMEEARKVRVVAVRILCKGEVVVEVLYKEAVMVEVENGLGEVENGMLVVAVKSRYKMEVEVVSGVVAEVSVVEVVNCSSREGVEVGNVWVGEVETQ